MFYIKRYLHLQQHHQILNMVLHVRRWRLPYAAFANGGTYYKPSYVKSIKFEDGSTKSYDSKGVKAMSPQTAYMMNSMLKQVFDRWYSD